MVYDPGDRKKGFKSLSLYLKAINSTELFLLLFFFSLFTESTTLVASCIGVTSLRALVHTSTTPVREQWRANDSRNIVTPAEGRRGQTRVTTDYRLR